MAKIDVEALRANFSDPHDIVHASDGKILFVRRWNSKTKPLASILILHGITAYSAPYGPMVAEQLSQAGYNVFGLDLRGHGLSDGTRGDYPSEERLVKDLRETISQVRSDSEGKLIIFGHSLGALSAITAVNNVPEIDGLILLSAARKIRTNAYSRPKASQILTLLFAVSIARRRPMIEYRRAGMVGIDDPLFNFKYSANFYSVMYGVGALEVSRMFRSGVINSPNLKFNQKLRTPLFVGGGENDELFPPEYVKEFCDEIDCDNKQLAIFPKARHAVFPKDGLGPLISWLSKNFGGELTGPSPVP
jgi:acylglycerol lipase